MSKKYYAVYPGQIKIDNEVFFGIDYKITDFINELMEQCKKQKEVIDKITDLIKQYGKYDGEKCTRGFQMWSADFNKMLEVLKVESDE